MGEFIRLHSLWASFAIKRSAGPILHIGDRGFGKGAFFREIAGRHPDIRVATLPIGDY